MTKRERKSHQVNLTIATLGELDNGIAGATINAALRAAIRDTEDRGGEDRKMRKVTIEVEMNKIGSESVAVRVRAKSTLPPYQTSDTISSLMLNERGQPELAFSPVASDNPDQGPLPGSDGE